MSGFDQIMQSAFGLLSDIYGVDAIYTPADGGAQLDVKVLAGPIETEYDDSDGNETKLRHRRIGVDLAEVDNPGKNDCFKINGSDWIAVEGPDTDAGYAVLRCRIDEPISKASEFGKKKLPA